MKVISKSLEETSAVAQGFLNTLKPGEQATVVGLFGDLGSGKTTFSQAVGKILGITEFMTSPTFVIQKVYPINFLNFKQLIHIDAYRLEKASELEVLGFKDLIKDPQNLIMVEWPERVSGLLPANLIRIEFKFLNENEREIQY